MERSAIEPGIVQQVRANALETYLGLVEPVDGAVASHTHGFTLVRGPGVFSFCNFAAGFDVPSEDLGCALQALKENAEQCPNFYVFSITGDSPADFERSLVGSGFEPRQALTSMAWSGVAPGPTLTLERAVSTKDRLSAAEFMARQFFWQMPEEAKSAISMATAASRHLLLTVGPATGPEAAVMLVPYGGTLGLFNLCVKPARRGSGLGTGIVQAIQYEAARSGSAVVLHCGGHLVPWYLSLGFGEVGTVATFVRSNG